MKEKELLQLADYLETDVHDDHWNFNYWASRILGPDHPFTYKLGSCGTQGCALGFGAMLFPNDLRLIWNGAGAVVQNVKTGSRNISAAEDFFLLSHDQAMEIFTDSGYSGRTSRVTKEMVAAKIRAMVANPI